MGRKTHRSADTGGPARSPPIARRRLTEGDEDDEKVIAIAIDDEAEAEDVLADAMAMAPADRWMVDEYSFSC